MTAPEQIPWHLAFPLTSSLLYVAAAMSIRQAAQAGAGIWRSTFVMNIVVAICFLPLLAGSGGEGAKPMWQAGLVAALFAAGQLMTMIALNLGDVSVATPVVGTKVIFVTIFVTLIVGDRMPLEYWLAAGMSAVGVALVNQGRQRKIEADGRHMGMTVAASLGAAVSYGLFDVLVRKWAPAWGVSRLLPTVMGLSALLSFGLWPLFEGRLRELPLRSRVPLVVGSLLLGIQAMMLTRTLGLYPDTTRINVVYNSRGLWSVLAVWLVGHWWGNTERHAGSAAFAWKIAGACFLLGAIVLAVFRPITH